MEEDIRLELFTVADLRDWLLNNHPVRGLSEQLMSATRAYSILKNPYVQNETYIISALFVGDNLGAYTAVFPDVIGIASADSDDRIRRSIYWNTTLYVNPKYEGKGYAYIVIANICECYGADYFDHAAAPASVENFKFMRMGVDYVPQFIFSPKSIHRNTLKGKLAYLGQLRAEHERKDRCKVSLERIRKENFALEYVTFVDAQTYTFIEAHAQKDLFLRSQEMFNWMLRYPFSVAKPMKSRVCSLYKFELNAADYRLLGVRVVKDSSVVGFYMFTQMGDSMAMKYLYYEDECKQIVFDSIVEHLLVENVKTFSTYDEQLSNYVDKARLFARKSVYSMSFTHPADFMYNKQLRIQAGDGDMFS